ncbi:hypothetical protein EHS25_008756 [Saitozyma podzolica]|uniref:Uncharacterized protein n=1 Tax=Saitozyma podzolica TaxID=1890683 RepID=A0A427YMS4_9TREE|nr:hypothetical protein EHS25_008756 [Saitozyma podzolica]
MLGTLIRLGLDGLATFDGNVIYPLAWAQGVGCGIMGLALARKNEIISIYPPIYTFLTTGIAGSVTTFSSWMLESYLAFSNFYQYDRGGLHDLPGIVTPWHALSGRLELRRPSRSRVHTHPLQTVDGLGYSFSTFAISMACLHWGEHVSSVLPSLSTVRDVFGSDSTSSSPEPKVQPQTNGDQSSPESGSWDASTPPPATDPTPLASRHTPILDGIIISTAFIAYLIVLLVYFLSNPSFRHPAVFPLLLAPPGAILRFLLANLNPLDPFIDRFPLGTFLANMIATLVISGVFAAQRRPPTSGGPAVTCNALAPDSSQDDTTDISLPPIAHPDILRRILSFADKPALATCLRTHSIFFDIAGAQLYHTVGNWRDERPTSLTALTKGASIITSTSSDGSRPARTNFKSQLLGYVRILEIRDHPCCEEPDIQAACGQFTGLEVLRNMLGRIPNTASRYALAPCKRGGACPLREIHANKVVMGTLPELWPALAFRYRSALNHSHHRPGAGQHLGSECDGGRTVRILYAPEGHAPSVIDKVTDDFDNLLELGAEVYIMGDPDDHFKPGWFCTVSNRWYPEVNGLNYKIARKQTAWWDATRGFSSSSSTRGAPPLNLLRSRADYLKLGGNCGDLDDEMMDELREYEAAYLSSKEGR